MDSALDLDGYKVLDRQETEHDIRFTVVWEPDNLVCPECGSMARPWRHGMFTQVYMDMPIRTKRVVIRDENVHRTMMTVGPHFTESDNQLPYAFSSFVLQRITNQSHCAIPHIAPHKLTVAAGLPLCRPVASRV
jgi:hypothetical protein